MRLRERKIGIDRVKTDGKNRLLFLFFVTGVCWNNGCSKESAPGDFPRRHRVSVHLWSHAFYKKVWKSLSCALESRAIGTLMGACLLALSSTLSSTVGHATLPHRVSGPVSNAFGNKMRAMRVTWKETLATPEAYTAQSSQIHEKELKISNFLPVIANAFNIIVK